MGAARGSGSLAENRNLNDAGMIRGSSGRLVSNVRDERLKDYAAAFLSRELPPALRPTANQKRLQAALVWGTDQFIDVVDVAPGGGLTAGHSSAARFSIAHPALGAATRIVQAEGDGFRVLLPQGADAHIVARGKDHTLEEWVADGRAREVEVPVKGAVFDLGLDDRVTLAFGQLQLVLRYTRPSEAQKRPIGSRLDIDFATLIVVLLMVGIAFERMVALADLSHLDGDDDLTKRPPDTQVYIAQVAPPPKPLQLAPAVTATAAPQPPGMLGPKSSALTSAKPAPKGGPQVNTDKIKQNAKVVSAVPLLQLLNADGAMTKILGNGGDSNLLNKAIDGIDPASKTLVASGNGGLTARGDGPGGGGDKTIGIGSIGSHAGGTGLNPNEYKFGYGRGGKPPPKFTQPTILQGGLGADTVGRIVRNHWNEIKFCYEKELSKAPNLAGKVSVSFEIGPVGDVVRASVGETDLHSSNVEECMLANIRRWKFPNPRGGGVVDVNYPFIFQSGQL